MKIKESDGTIINVFGIYWFSDGETYFYGLPRDFGGLSAYSSDEVVVVDNSINFRTLYLKTENAKGFYHWALIQDALLDEVIDHDAPAFNRFLNIIKSEGLVEPDFY